MSYTPLTEAARDGKTAEIRRLLQQGSGVDKKDGNGDTALIRAALNGRLEAVRLLLEKGAGVDLKQNDGWTALHCAACRGHVEVAKELLRAGASVDLKKKDGYTALHVAAHHGHVEVAKELLRAGASTDIRSNNNETALDVANRNNKSEVASVLRDPQAHIALAEVREEERGGGTAGERRSTSLCAFLNICFIKYVFRIKRPCLLQKIILAGFFYHSAKERATMNYSTFRFVSPPRDSKNRPRVAEALHAEKGGENIFFGKKNIF